MHALDTQICNYKINKFLLHMEIIGNYHHITTMNGTVNYVKLSHLLSVFFSKS